MSLPNDLINKILLYNIHPTAEIIKPCIKLTNETENKDKCYSFLLFLSWYPNTPFRTGCYICRKYFQKQQRALCYVDFCKNEDCLIQIKKIPYLEWKRNCFSSFTGGWWKNSF